MVHQLLVFVFNAVLFNFPEFGDHEMHLIKKNLPSTLIQSGVDVDEIYTEWAIIKSLIYQR